jgi:hypothetical protein
MPLPWDLEDWLTNEGDRVVRLVANGQDLTPDDRLLEEVWLLDTEQRNGGVSQYFANQPERWHELRALAISQLPSFAVFATEVDAVLSAAADPYDAITQAGVDLDALYDGLQREIVAELRRVIEPSGAHEGAG